MHFQNLEQTTRRFVIERGDHQPPGIPSEGVKAPDPKGAVKRMHAALKINAARFAANVLPTIKEIQASGQTSQNAIAGQLNARKVATARGGKWTHVQVRQILDRMAERDAEQ
jgi:hypothetical protein